MLRRYCAPAILVTTIIVSFAGCSSNVTLPESLPGVWIEDRNKVTWPGEPRFEKSTSSTSLRFEQQNKRAVVFVSTFYDPFKKENNWSEPYSLSESAKNNWSFKYRGREVSLKLDENNQLQVRGLSVRSYNQDLVKREPELVEAIFIKKN
jgi:hypothetical protein